MLFVASNCSAFQQLQDSEATLEAVKVIRGLKERRLFDLAQIYATQQLESELIDRTGKSTILLERIRAKVAEAVTLTDDQRSIGWDQAQQFASDFLVADPQHPRKILIVVQDALTNFSNGKLVGQEIAAEIAPVTAKQSALDQFRIATRKFRDAEQQIEKTLPVVRNRSLQPSELTPDQLVNLKNNIRYQLAAINLAKAQMYDVGDRLNQIDAINQVLKRLDEVIRQTNSEAPLWWQAQISRAQCYRVMGQFDDAKRVFASLPEVEITLDLKSEISTEQIQIAVGSESYKDAGKLLADAQELKNRPPRMDLAVLQLLMMSASHAAEPEKKSLQQQATQLVTEIETNHGRYWGRRAEILLVGSIKPALNGQSVASSDFAILVRQGDSAMRKGNFDDAVKAYSKAAEFAASKQDANQAIALTVRIAQCYEQQKQHQAAAERLLEIANRFPNAASSADVHLRGLWNWARTASDDPDKKALFAEYLREQIAKWPAAESTNQARIWLGNHYQSNSKWEAAVGAYLDIDIESSKMFDAVKQIGPAARRWIDSLDSNSEHSLVSKTISGMIRDKLEAQDPASTEQWNEAKRWLLLTLVDVGMPVDAVKPHEAILLLDSAIAGSSDEDLPWCQQAEVRRIVAMAKNGADTSELESRTKELPNNAGLMRVCLNGIDSNMEKNGSLDSLIILICDKAMTDSDAKVQLQFWQLRKAVTAAGTGDVGSAVSVLARLAAANPKSLEIQLEYARALTSQQGNTAEALQQWRRLATKLKAGTEPWFESKYNIALLLSKNDHRAEALQMLKYLNAIPPGWKQSKLKQQFDQLLSELN